MQGSGLTPRVYTALFLAGVALILAFSDKGLIDGDGIKRWEALDSLMSKGELTRDKYSIIQPLFAAPLYALGDSYARLTGASPAARVHLIRSVVKRFNKVVAFAVVCWVFFLLRTAAGWSAPHASLAASFLLFGSLLIPHAKDFFSECLWSLLSLLGLTLYSALAEATYGTVSKPLAGLLVLLLALSAALNPVLFAVYAACLVVVAAVRIAGAAREGLRAVCAALLRPDIVLAGVGMGCGAGLCLLENALRRGAALDFGYPGEGFSTPLWRGLAGQFFAPARGLVFFMPTFFCGLALAWRGAAHLGPRLHRLIVSSLVFCAALVLVYAKWHAWHGAWYWGPRFLLPLSICGGLYYVLVLRVFWARSRVLTRLGLAALGVLSFMTYKAGVAIGHGPLMACLEERPAGDYCYWQWDFTPLYSWFQRDDLRQMLTHRSTAVELAALAILVTLTVCAGPRRPDHEPMNP